MSKAFGRFEGEELRQAWSEGRLKDIMTDEEFEEFLALDEDEKAEIMTAGMVELSDEDLESVAGGWVGVTGSSCYTYSCG